MPAIWPNPSSHWRPGEGQSSWCRVACRSRPPNSSARASARCMAGSGRTARAAWPRCSPKTGTPRRAISPLTPVAGRPQPMMMTRRLCAAGSRNRNRGNALMREVAEARRKRPRRRPAAPVEQGEDPVDRPVEAGVFARLDGMLARHRAERPPTATTPGSALTSTPDSGQRWPGRSPIPRAGTGTAGSRRWPGPAYRRSRSAGSWRRKGSWRMCPSDAGIVPTRARRRRLPPISSTGTSRPSVRTRNGPRTSPGIKARDGKGVPFAAGRLLRWQDRRIHRRLQPQRGAGQPDAGESGLDAAGERASPGAFRPWMPLPVARMARAHGTLRADALHEREGLFAGQRGRGGILRRDEDRGGLPREVGGTHP